MDNFSFHAAGPFNPMFCEDGDNYFDDGSGGGGFGGGSGYGLDDSNSQEGFGPLIRTANLSPEDVKQWMGRQHPDVIKEINFHSRWLLEKMGMPIDSPGGSGGQRFDNNQSGNPFAEDEDPADGGKHSFQHLWLLHPMLSVAFVLF